MGYHDKLEIDQIHCSNAVAGLRTLPDGCIPLTVTSPPYDGLRDYEGHKLGHEMFEQVARELWRVTMPGGVVAWVVADEIKGGHSGTSFRQALHFQEIGFRLHDILIMTRTGGRWSGVNHYGKVEYAFVLSKGRPRFVDLIRDKPNKHAGVLRQYRARRADGRPRKAPRFKPVATMGLKGPVWEYPAGYGGTTRDRYAYGHPALMPEAMARDLIISWSRPGDLVLDPFLGGGTTAKMALLNHRRHLGFEVHRPYFQLAVRRLRDAHAEYRRRLDAWLSDVPMRLAPPTEPYEVVYADPPWPFRSWSRTTRGRNVQDYYRTMPLEEIEALPVGRIAARDSVLLMWTTGPFLDRAVGVIEAWGFRYKTIAFTWVKTTRSGTGRLHIGNGYHTRSNSELCLLATRGKGLPRQSKAVHQVVISPVGRHSEKPAEVRQRIESLYGARRRIELFARSGNDGWDALGDALDGRDIREALSA